MIEPLLWLLSGMIVGMFVERLHFYHSNKNNRKNKTAEAKSEPQRHFRLTLRGRLRYVWGFPAWLSRLLTPRPVLWIYSFIVKKW